jgi:hypothetical protein
MREERQVMNRMREKRKKGNNELDERGNAGYYYITIVGSEKNVRFCDLDERSKAVMSWMREDRQL